MMQVTEKASFLHSLVQTAPFSQDGFYLSLKNLYLKAPVRDYIGPYRWLSSKESTCNAGDVGLTPRSERSPRKGNDNLLQYSCLGNPIDTGVGGTTVHGVAKELDRT